MKVNASLQNLFLFIFSVGETEYEYSGSEDEVEEPPIDGEPSSIALQPSESTLRRNFLKLQQENKEKWVVVAALQMISKRFLKINIG